MTSKSITMLGGKRCQMRINWEARKYWDFRLKSEDLYDVFCLLHVPVLQPAPEKSIKIAQSVGARRTQEQWPLHTNDISWKVSGNARMPNGSANNFILLGKVASVGTLKYPESLCRHVRHFLCTKRYGPPADWWVYKQYVKTSGCPTHCSRIDNSDCLETTLS